MRLLVLLKVNDRHRDVKQRIGHELQHGQCYVLTCYTSL